MADIKLDENNDILFDRGSLTLTSGTESHAQRLTMHLSTFLGESRYDRAAGFPWLQIVFAERQPLETTRMILDIYSRTVPGIVSTDYTVGVDPATRRLDVGGTVTTIDGNVNFELTPL